MDKFREFHSINNVHNVKFMNTVMSNKCIDEEWVVTEKVHGANFSIYTNGNIIKAARRSAFITNDELSKFFNADKLIERYRDDVLNLYKQVNRELGGDNILVLRGELFGGIYFNMPTKFKRVQKGVNYCPHIEFIIFDLSWANAYLSWDYIELKLQQFSIPYCKPLFRGSFKEAIEWSASNKYADTIIPKMFGLNNNAPNLREGHVLRPVVPSYTIHNEFIILKDKNSEFEEKNNAKSTIVESKISPETANVINEICKGLVPARLDNIFSKLLPEDRELFITKKNIKKIAGLLAKDVMLDYNKENKYKCPNKESQEFKKIIMNEAIKFCLTQIDSAV
jgi:Rnl2 family RNA ligase